MPVEASQEVGSEADENTPQRVSPLEESGSSNDEMAMKDVPLGAVPEGYYDEAEQQGSLESFAYDTRDYAGSGNAVEREATVYLPYGYEQNDTKTRYNILYLQHGAYGDERTWMYEYGDRFKNMIDHMIEDGTIPPLIIVMPYLAPGSQWYHDTTPIFYSDEVKNDLMPAVEAHYRTYAEDVSDSGFAASRSHRAFGGFSAGGTTTWRVFLEGLDRFEYFLPMSGGLTLGGDGSTDDEDASALAAAALASSHGKRDYYVFAATGTQDVAYQGLSAQIERMKPLDDAFDFTEVSFAEGNLMYYTVEGNRHDYPYTYEYVYNGLRCLFSWVTTRQMAP
ncbi:MAG: alpha/beta hydrolase-fold protein [Coriobacteriia bacterium]|nr:alpha/beta hydrolase-fold protein [Coriobacteriia bacterium]